MTIHRVLVLFFMLLFVSGVHANENRRFLCTKAHGEHYFTKSQKKGCVEIELERGWVNFDILPIVIVDIKVDEIRSEQDGKTILMRYYFSDAANDINGKFQYDFLESKHKFYCGKMQTSLVEGKYMLSGKTVHVNLPAQAVIESVDHGTINEAVYNYLCETVNK